MRPNTIECMEGVALSRASWETGTRILLLGSVAFLFPLRLGATLAVEMSTVGEPSSLKRYGFG